MNTPSSPEEALKLLPEDLSKMVESVMHVYQGNHDHLPELLSHAGTLLLKVGRKMSTRQLLMIGGLLAVGTLLVIRKTTEENSDDEATGSQNGEHRAASNDKP